MPVAAVVFEIGGGATHGDDASREEVGNGITVPGGGHGNPETVDLAQRGRLGLTLMVMGIEGQHGKHLARSQANADIDHPNEPLAKGGTVQRQAPRVRAESRRTMVSRITQLMMVCGHGACWMPRARARSVKTRETARKLIRASQKSCRAKWTTSTLGRVARPCSLASSSRRWT